MPKGGGNKKGKHPTKKPAPKHPLRVSSESDEEEVVDQGVILAQVETLERAHGLPPGDHLLGCLGKGAGLLVRLLKIIFNHRSISV